MNWKLPLDADKPACPYVEDFKTIIKTHNPPSPLGGNYGPGNRPQVPDDWLRGVTQSRHVLEYPPLETADPQSPMEAELTIVKTIRTGDARGAQLVLCSIAPLDAGEKYHAVAKIYDALYYSFECKMFGGRPIDVVQNADEDYSQEAAAYEHLRAEGLTGSIAPGYFGSWTFTLPFKRDGETLERPIRLVLIEYLDGLSMISLYSERNDAFDYEEKFRLDVFAQVLDGVSKIVHAGISHGDIAPRNVMLIPQGGSLTSSPPHVVLFDYNRSVVWERTTSGRNPKTDKPKNPMKTWWGDCFEDFEGWIPDEWRGHPKLRQQWLLSQFGGEDVKTYYEAVTEELKFSEYVY